MRQKIAAMHIVTGASESSITMTFGIAEFENDRESTDCVDRADQALYRGKISGKNCVKVFRE
jgi:PleD family two-component response regulator